MPQMASALTQQKIDAEVSKIVNKAYAQCKATLETNRPLLDAVVNKLLEDETIGNDELKELVKAQAVPAAPAAAVPV
jgi:ATP-dependent Zn protease